MTPEEQNALRSNIRQYRAASLFQVLAIVGGLIAAIWKGLPAVVLGVAVCWLFHLAKPGPTEDLDRLTGRK